MKLQQLHKWNGLAYVLAVEETSISQPMTQTPTPVEQTTSTTTPSKYRGCALGVISVDLRYAWSCKKLESFCQCLRRPKKPNTTKRDELR